MDKVATKTQWAAMPATPMARIDGLDGLPITKASLTSISLSVYDSDTAALIVGPIVVDIAVCVFDTLQIDSKWIKAGGDEEGFNFAHYIGPTAFPDGEKIYSVEYAFVPVTGDPFPYICQVKTKQRPSTPA